MDTVVVGASLAAVRTVEALRAAGSRDCVVVIGDEVHEPYDRPPLSKEILTGKLAHADIHLRADLAELDVDLRLGQRAIGVDGSEVVLADGVRVPFDELVVATGARPRRLDHLPSLAGVEVLRTIEDAHAIALAMEAGPEVVVIGAGFIGSEVASAARDRGLSVTVLEALSAPMCRVFAPAIGARFAKLHAEAGSRLLCDERAVDLVGVERVEGVVVEDGTVLPADLVIVGVGAIPNTEWLDGLGLDLTNGVACDDRGRALGAAHIHAVGDVARWTSLRTGGAVRTEHWTAAGDQAAAAAADLLGTDPPDESVPYVWSDQFGRRIQVCGHCHPDDHVVVTRDDDDAFVALTARDGQLVSVVAMDDPKRFGALRRLLLRGASLDDGLIVANK